MTSHSPSSSETNKPSKKPQCFRPAADAAAAATAVRQDSAQIRVLVIALHSSDADHPLIPPHRSGPFAAWQRPSSWRFELFYFANSFISQLLYARSLPSIPSTGNFEIFRKIRDGIF